MHFLNSKGSPILQYRRLAGIWKVICYKANSITISVITRFDSNVLSCLCLHLAFILAVTALAEMLHCQAVTFSFELWQYYCRLENEHCHRHLEDILLLSIAACVCSFFLP